MMTEEAEQKLIKADKERQEGETRTRKKRRSMGKMKMCETHVEEQIQYLVRYEWDEEQTKSGSGRRIAERSEAERAKPIGRELRRTQIHQRRNLFTTRTRTMSQPSPETCHDAWLQETADGQTTSYFNIDCRIVPNKVGSIAKAVKRHSTRQPDQAEICTGRLSRNPRLCGIKPERGKKGPRLGVQLGCKGLEETASLP
jgi:hypothetical protein